MKMAIMTEEQVKLLHKLQTAGIPAFAEINPLTLSRDEAADLFKMNLPPVEWFDVTGVTKDHEFVEKRFVGVSENNCREQMNHWLEKENLTLLQQPNPKFGSGQDWLAYFAQPMGTVNTNALENHFRKWEISVPKIKTPDIAFSGLKLAFDDCPEEHLEIYAQYRLQQDEKAINKVTPEQRAMIKSLQSTGKAPKIDRNDYLSFTRRDAAAYIKENENNPENTFAVVVYPRRVVAAHDEAFPQFKKSNLFSQEQADYLQRSIIRDLVNEGHVATPETRQELLDKLEYITSAQAADLIEPHADKPAGAGLLEQCKAYIDSGKIHNEHEIKTVIDVHRLYNNNRSLDFDAKAALRDLIEGGYIRTDDGLAKIKFTTEEQEKTLIAKYGDAPIGGNLRARLYSLIDENKIGNLDDDQFKKLTVRDGMQIISRNAEIEQYKRRQAPATPNQKELLRKMADRGQIDLRKVDLNKITFGAAHQLINQNMTRVSPQNNGLATLKQRGLLKALVEHKLIPSIPYPEWKSMTAARAFELIASVPEEQRKNLSVNSPSPAPPGNPRPQTAPER